MIRDFIEAEVGTEIAKFLRIIYSGPVSKQNAEQLIKMEDVDGFLVHDKPSMSQDFQTIVDDVDRHWKKGDDSDGNKRRRFGPGGGGGPALLDPDDPPFDDGHNNDSHIDEDETIDGDPIQESS